jgi:SpoVK/Ycf46/Vps4 family AAA+-type ATPase
LGDEVAENTSSQAEEDTLLTRKAKQVRNGSGRTRLNRPRQPEGLPPFKIPDWFLAKNVKCVGDAELAGSLAVFGGGVLNLKEDNKDVEEAMRQSTEVKGQSTDMVECDLTPTTDAKYSIHVDVYKEIFATLKAGLALRPPRNTNKTVVRPHTVLQCPKDGATSYLDSIVETVATKLGADLVRLDTQDLAQIIGPYVDENLAWTGTGTSFLSYHTQKVAGKMEEYENDISVQEDGEGAEDEEEGPAWVPRRGSKLFSEQYKRLSSILSVKKLGSLPVSRYYGDSHSQEGPIIGVELRGFGGPGSQLVQSQTKSTEDQWRDMKVSTVLDSLIGAADSKRTTTETGETELVAVDPVHVRDVIVQLKDYTFMTRTAEGPPLLEALRSAVNKRWSEGRNIILVGTTSSEECGLSRSEIQHLQSDITSKETRTIFVPPDRREEQDVAFESDEKTRIRHINIRHLEDMIVKLTEGAFHPSPVVNIEKDLDNATAYSAGLEDAVWQYPRVHRVATTILGLKAGSNDIDGTGFTEALKLLANSDEAKFGWGAAELKLEDDDVDIMLKDLNVSSKNITKEKIKQIKQNCTTHEKRLLGGVIIPSDIHTTFENVHAPKETVEALKTLTSLSLIRPEAFSYGVLATDKIPGLLLYGPPGTGKTLLAKAVAKESGATVLEVSGAEVNDMYVGEGEKNVKAIFTLAKKLSPCVVFIDEADAIFAQRTDMKRSGTHRELINQFLREWDGMNDMSAFIMVATNRPFDLDEAVLRRLPRRLLVDLPVEKDREAILKIHLKDEILDESVSLATLAKNTPYYSGSDLKNISVAAAFACIREENEVATKHTGPEPYVYPEKRILTKQHFDKALDEISASISEDMSTLAAIRKFDEKYGDRKGRRKKGSGLGFGGTTVQEKDSEGGRVRKVQA